MRRAAAILPLLAACSAQPSRPVLLSDRRVPRRCGVERQTVKVARDTEASRITLDAVTTTISDLRRRHHGVIGKGTRYAPEEMTVFELADVRLVAFGLEADGDYHLVIADHGRTMIVEAPDPTCMVGSALLADAAAARHAIDRTLSVSRTMTAASPAMAPITVRGVGFFDGVHGQRGMAPNGIELHPLLAVCWGLGCSATPSIVDVEVPSEVDD